MMEKPTDLPGKKCRPVCKVMTRILNKQWFLTGMKIDLDDRVRPVSSAWIGMWQDEFYMWVNCGE